MVIPGADGSTARTFSHMVISGIAKHRGAWIVQMVWHEVSFNRREENTVSTEEHIGGQPNGTLVENGKGGRILAGVANRNMQVKFLLP